jgi:hypothetical protein
VWTVDLHTIFNVFNAVSLVDEAVANSVLDTIGPLVSALNTLQHYAAPSKNLNAANLARDAITNANASADQLKEIISDITAGDSYAQESTA